MSLTEQEQLLLPFNVDPLFSFENFIVGPDNRATYDAVRQFCREIGESVSMVIIGDPGTGKTHLLSAVARDQYCTKGLHVYFCAEQIIHFFANEKYKEDGFKIVSQFQNYSLFILDELEKLDGHFLTQEFIIYLFNMIRSNRGRMLFGSRINPEQMTGLRSELKSRLLWGKVIQLKEPGDNALGMVMRKIALDRNIKLSDDLVNFLTMRLPRSLSEYVRVIDTLDRQSSRLSRNIAIPLAKDLFNL